jgi:hypothetical protein
MIQRAGPTFARYLPVLCLSALLLGSTALSAQAPDDLAAHLAMPIASDLAGARDTPRFAWIENAAGARNIWVGGPDMVAHGITNNGEDDGVELSDVTLSNDGTAIAFVRGGDSEYPDDAPAESGVFLHREGMPVGQRDCEVVGVVDLQCTRLPLPAPRPRGLPDRLDPACALLVVGRGPVVPPARPDRTGSDRRKPRPRPPGKPRLRARSMPLLSTRHQG